MPLRVAVATEPVNDVPGVQGFGPVFDPENFPITALMRADGRTLPAVSSLHAANRARSQQARSSVRRCLAEVPDVEVLEHPDDAGLLVVVDAGGVVVVDGRGWSGDVVLDGARLLCSGRDRSDVLHRLGERLDAVRGRTRGVDVRGAIVVDRPGQSRLTLGDVVVLSIDDLAGALAARPRVLPAAHVRSTCAGIRAEPDTAEPDTAEHRRIDERDRSPALDRWVQVVYLASSGSRRLALYDRGGRRLGEQQRDASVAVFAPEHDALVRAVLRAATPSGLQLLPASLPKVPVEVVGGRLMGRLGGLYKIALIGHRWRKGSTDRLYGTFASPTEGVVALGYVDLVTGEMHPSGGDPVAKDRQAPADYLRRLHQDLPPL